MAEDKKTILNLISELKQEYFDFFEEQEIVVHQPDAEIDDINFILIDGLSDAVIKVARTWQADYTNSKIVYIGEPQTTSQFISDGGAVFISPDLIDSEFGKVYLRRVFLQEFSTKIVDVFPIMANIHRYKIDNHFRSGYFSDVASVIAAEGSFDVFPIRKALLNSIYFLESLSKTNNASAPYELEVFVSKSVVGFQVVASSKDFYKEFVLSSLDQDKKDLCFLADVVESSHISDIFYLEQGQKIGLTNYFFAKKPLVKSFSIQGVKYAKNSSDHAGISSIVDSYVRNIEEKVEQLKDKELPSRTFEIINFNSHGTLLEKTPGEMLELAMFAKEEFDKEGLSSEQQASIELTNLKDTLHGHHNTPLINMLEQEDLVDIRLILEEPKVLEKFKDLLEKEERLVQRDLSNDVEDVFGERLENAVADALNENTLVKGNGEGNLEEDSFRVNGEEDLGEDSTRVSGNGEDNQDNDSFLISGEKEEGDNSALVVSGNANEEDKSVYTISSSEVQEISTKIRSSLKNIAGGEEKLSRDALTEEVFNVCKGETDLTDEQLKEVIENCVDGYIRSQASNNLGQNLVDLAKVDKSLLKAKDMEIRGLEKKISELESNLKVYQAVDEVSDGIDESIEDMLDHQDIELFKGLDDININEVRVGQINAFAAENIKRTIEEAAVMRDKYNEMLKDRRRLELQNNSQRAQFEAELSKALRDKQRREHLLMKTKELMAKQVTMKDRFIADERDRVNQMRKELMQLKITERIDNKEVADLKDQVASFKKRYESATENLTKLKTEQDKESSKPQMNLAKFMELKTKLEKALKDKDARIEELKADFRVNTTQGASTEISKSSDETVIEDGQLQQEIEKREKLEAKNKKLLEQIENLEKQIVDNQGTRPDTTTIVEDGSGAEDSQETKNYKEKNSELLKQISELQLGGREKDQFMKDAEEKMQEVAGRVKELEHKLKIAQSIQKSQEKELKMKQRRAGASVGAGESQKAKFLEKNLEKANEAKKKAEAQLIDVKKAANKLKSENTKLKNELDEAKRKLGKSAA